MSGGEAGPSETNGLLVVLFFRSNPVAVRAWEHDGQAKVVLRVADAAELYVALQKPGEQEQERDCLDGEDDGEAMLWEAANTTQLPFPPFNPPFPPRFAVQQRAQEARLVTAVIRDAGHTQIDPGTVTVLAVGPERADRVDGVTGKLKLL